MLFAQAGITSENDNLNVTNLRLQLTSCLAAVMGALLVDRLGRRKVLLTGNTLMVFLWTIISILCATYANEGNTNVSGAQAAIAFINIFGITFSFCYTPLQILYPVECLSYETRAKGMGVYNLFTNVAMFFNTYGLPAIMEKIGWKFFLVYIPWNCVQVVWIYFLYVHLSYLLPSPPAHTTPLTPPQLHRNQRPLPRRNQRDLPRALSKGKIPREAQARDIPVPAAGVCGLHERGARAVGVGRV